MIRLTLPYPISANRYWRTYSIPKIGRAVTTLSQEAKDYKRTVAIACKQARIGEPLQGRVKIDIELYPNRPQDAHRRIAKDPEAWDDTVQCIDLDNANKVLLDALKGLAFEDDKWVRELHSRRMEPVGEACVVVIVAPVLRAVVQPALPLPPAQPRPAEAAGAFF